MIWTDNRYAKGGALSILAVTSQLPWPLNSGGNIRSYHMLCAMARRFRVRLVVPIIDGNENGIEPFLQQGITVCPVPSGKQTFWREVLKTAGSVLQGLPYVMYKRHERRSVRAAIISEIMREKPDAGYLDHLDSLVYSPCFAGIPLVLDLHNMYSAVARSAAEEQSCWCRRAFLRHEARLLERVEKSAGSVADTIFCVSEQEAAHFSTLGCKKVNLVPNGVDCSVYSSLPIGRKMNPPALLYVGAMSWQPNVQAARFLANEVLPKIRVQFPEARLLIVGQNPASEVTELRQLPGVEVTGTVPQIAPYLRDASLLAVALEAGGGTRLKILEAFAAGLPVVSTPLGCEGLRVLNNEHLLIASRECFVERIQSLLNDADLQYRLAENGRSLALESYDWKGIGEVACRAIEEMAQSCD